MIKIKTKPSEDVLYGESKWWGFPDLPDELDWPTAKADDDGEEFDDPLTFICQIKCSDIAPLDPEGLLPHEGMLYFFAALDYFLGDLDAFTTPGMGEWPSDCFKVLYSPVCEILNTHTLMYDEDTPAAPAPEAISFGDFKDSYTQILGEPLIEEVREALPGYVPLLQIDENDDWGLRFFDCGMLCFMIKPENLAAQRFDRVRAYLYSA